MDRQTIFLIIFLLALGGGGWVWYQSRATSQESAAAGPSRDILEIEARMAEIRRLKNITIDTSVFQDPRFRALKDVRATSGPAVAPGRVNPFAPL